MTPWVTGAGPWSGINSSPFATMSRRKGLIPMAKHEELFGPAAPGNFGRSRLGIRVKSRSRHLGATDIPLSSRTTFPAGSTVISMPGRAPSCDSQP